jgi:hypothetical protein
MGATPDGLVMCKFGEGLIEMNARILIKLKLHATLQDTLSTTYTEIKAVVVYIFGTIHHAIFRFRNN